MSNATLARGYDVIGGTVGTDVALITTNSVSGNSLYHFPATATSSVKVATKWVPLEDVSVAADLATRYASVRAHVNAASNSAGEDVYVGIELANEARTSITSISVWDGPLPSTSVWHSVGSGKLFIGGSGAQKWARVVVYKSTNLNFDMYVDSIEFRRLPPYCTSEDAVGGTFTGSWATVAPGSNQIRTRTTETSGVLYINEPGVYSVSGHIEIEDSVADGDILAIRLKLRANSGASYFYVYQTMPVSAAYTPGNVIGMSVSTLFHFDTNVYYAPATPLTRGTAELQIAQHAGSFVDWARVYLRAARISE